MKKTLAIVILGFVLVLVIGGLSLYNLPLGQAMELEIPPELAQDQADSQQQDDRHPNKTCWEEGLVRLISIGQASPMDVGGYGADAIRLIWVDYDDPAVVILALPYKLWVDADVLDPGLDLPLNEIYQVSYERSSSSQPEVRTRKATQALAQALVDNYTFIPDHYLTIQQDAFIDFVDQAEIVVDVPYAITDVPEGWHTFEPGVQTMDGEQALDYVRLLIPETGEPHNNIWARFARQDQVLWALLDSALQWQNLDEIPEKVKVARKMLVTDLSVSQMNSLVCMLQETEDKVQIVSIPQELVAEEDGDMFDTPQDPGNLAYPELPPSIADLIAEINAGFVEE
jgi:anionic cell wall polymer biosynthesis LytR-Cps2A-Psr (LCP) family protein